MDPVLPAHPLDRPGQRPRLSGQVLSGRVPSGTRSPLHLLVGLVGLVAGLLLLLAAPASATTTAPAAPAAVEQVQQVQPVAPAGASPAAGTPVPTVDQRGPLPLRDGKGGLSQPISLVLLLGSMSLLPGMLIMVTAFTRIVIVMGLTRSALGTQGTPPNQVLIGLSLFLTLFVMGPALSQANEEAVQPFLKGTITQGEAFDKGIEPFREFMLKQVREQDLALFVELSGKPAPKNEADVPLTTLIPAYTISELRAAFLIGFIIFVPFLVIDLVVSAALSAMGMAMLPPSLVSLPFKLLLFVAVDGWALLVESLVRSFQ